MKEAQKTSLLRGPEFVSKYLSGKVIDIGAGKDLVCAWAEPFDLEHGDANVISRHRSQAAYDAVHSSHCLEHMHNPAAALRDWWSLLKPGGYLVVVVPEEDLYEQGIWPSKFNRDHKATFRLGRETTWSKVSFDLRELVLALPECELISAEIQDAGYDHSLRLRPGQSARKMPRGLKLLRSIGRRLPLIGERLKRAIENHAVRYGAPVDQTGREALAQIQVVACKRSIPLSSNSTS
jgi:SAM-dependent methyltransferase